jgi:N-acylneuraminate cytidylyltransferase
MYTITALLPMKGNSERVKNKNMRDFNGKPLYHAIVKTLLNVEYISKIVINTDSEIIASDAIKSFEDKITIINRPENIIGDFVSMNDIIAYDLSQVEGQYFLQTHSTNPMLTDNTLKNAIEFYFNNLDKYDSVFSVTKVQTRFYDTNSKPVNHDLKNLIRTQDIPPFYEENSNFYIFSKESFKNAGNKRIGLKPKMFETNKLESIDIDEPEDFILAEILYKNKELLCL